MNSLVSVGTFFLIVGLIVIGIVLLSALLASRRRQRLLASEGPIIPVNLASVNDGVLVARVGGQVLFANDVAKQWFNLEGGEPDLWLLSQRVEPAESFLELFATEGQSTFSLGSRNIEASSHRVAMGESVQFIVVMREEAPLPTLDREERGSGKALQILGEIARAINANLDLTLTLNATLDGLAHLIPHEAAQICLWDQEQERLRPVARSGPREYVEGVQDASQIYRLDEGYTGWVAGKRNALLVENVESVEDVQLLIRSGDPIFTSYMGVPLNVRNRFIGTLELMSEDVARFDREDLALLNLIADQAAIAIENARRYSTQAERVAELSGLQKIAGAISVLQDPYQLYSQLGQRVADLMQVEMAGVLLYDPEQERLVAQKPLYGVEDVLTTRYVIPLERGGPARSLWEDVTFWFTNDVANDRLIAELDLGMLAELTGVRMTAMAAMTVGDERIGVLQVSNKTDGSNFTLEDIRLLQIYADQAAIVVESARLYGEEQSRVAELQGLQQIVQVMSSFTNPDQLYEQLTQRIAELMDVEICGILLYEPTQDALVARAPFYGISSEVVAEYQIPVSKRGLARDVWRDYDLFESNNILTDEAVDALGLRDVARSAGLRTLIFAPLSAGGRRFGMLQVSNKTDGTDFDDGDKRLAAIFAGQAAALIENVRLYQDTDATLRKRSAELRSVSRISHELNATLELERILEVIAKEALRAEGAHWGNLTMFAWAESEEKITPIMHFGEEYGEEAHLLEFAAVRSGETLVIDDFDKVREVSRYPTPFPGARSALIVPIVFESKAVGVISLYSDQPGGLGESAAEYVQALSSQATIAVTNATRHAEQVERSELLRRRAEQLAQIFELGRVFRSDQSVEDNLVSVARAIRESVGFDVVVISAMGQEHTTLLHVAQVGLAGEEFESETEATWSLLERYMDDEYRLGGAYLVPGSASEELLKELHLPDHSYHPIADQPGYWQPGDVLFVPLRSSSDESMGILTVNHPQDGRIPSRDAIELLGIFANQAAIVIENSRLYRSVEERAEELSRSLSDLGKSYEELDKLSQEMIRKDAELSTANELLNQRAQRLLALHRVMESVDTTQNPEHVLQDIAASVVTEMDIDQCIIALSENGQSDDLAIVVAEGRVPKDFEPEKLINGKDPISIAHRTNKVMLYAPGGKREDPAEQTAQVMGAQTFVALPLHFDISQSGVLVVGSARPGAAFTDDDRDLFNLLASQLVVEYENARLYQTVQAEAATASAERDRLQQLHVITTALQQTRELDHRLAVIARGIRSVGWDRVALALVDENMDMSHLVTAGYDEQEETELRRTWLSGKVWQERLSDQEFMSMRIGSSYFLPHDHPWVTEHIKSAATSPNGGSGDVNSWHPGDQIYLPMYAGTQIIGLINLREPDSGLRPTEASLRPLELFVQQASSALENARLYQESLELKSYNEAVVQSIQQGIVVVDGDGKVESLNTFVKEQYGWSEDMIGQDLFEAQPTLKELGLDSLFSIAKEGKPVERTNAQYTQGDEVRTLNVYMYPRYDEERDMTGVVILIEDVTQRARLEADIALRGQQLAALSDVSRQISAALSVDAVIQSALEQAQDILDYDRITLWTRTSPDDDRLAVKGSRGQEGDITGQEISIEEYPLFADIADMKLPVAVSDVRKESRLPEGENATMRSWLGVPMVSGGMMTGVLVFEKAEVHTYAPADAQVAAAYANQVAVSLDNARLFEEATDRAAELQSRTRRLTLLNRVSSTLGRSLDQNSILQTAVDELVKALDAQQGSVFLFDEEAGIAQLALQSPSNPDGSVADITFSLNNNSLIDRLRETGAPLAIKHVKRSKLAETMRDALAERGVVSTLSIPIILGSTFIGMITVDATEAPRDFETEQIEIAQTIINQAAVSVQNARLFQETVVRQRELGILFEAGRIASASLDLDTVVNNAAGYFIRALEVDGCTITLWDKAEDALIALIDFAKSEGPRPLSENLNRYNLKQYPATLSVIDERGVLVLNANAPDLSKAEADWMAGRSIATTLMLPLVARDETIGLAELWDNTPGRRHTQRDLRMARALATSIATAMENARLHDETQQRLSELSTINELSRALAQTISTDDLFQILQSQISQVLDVPSLTIAQRDPLTGQLVFPLALREGLRIHIDPIGYGADLYSAVIETREPLMVNRNMDEKLKELGVDHIELGLRSFLGVPLVSGEKVLGILAVEDYERENAFHEADLRVLGPIAAQVSVSLENVRLYSELEQRLSETTTLQEVSRVVNSALDLAEIFERVVSELADAFKYPLIGIFTLKGDELQIRSSYGYDKEEIERLRRVPLDIGIIGRAARTGEPQFVQDVSKDSDYLLIKEWAKSGISVPIVSDERVLGVLNVQSGSDDPLDDNDLQLLRTFAGQVATAMVNASLFAQMVELHEELERRVEERTRELREERDRIDTLFSITVELTASLDLDRVLNQALELVGEAVGAEHGSLYLIDPQSDKLIHRAVMRGQEILPPGGRQIPLSRHEGMAGWVMDNRQSIVVDNVQLDPRWSNVPGTEHNRSLLGAPLISNEEVLGCIFFTSDTEGAFSEGHVRLVEAAANQVATSINNAELYRLIRDQAERLGSMLRSQQTEAAKSQAILESVADGVMVSDQAGEIILFNAAAERILELRRDEVLGRSSTDLAGLYGAGAQKWTDMLHEWSEDPTGRIGEFLSAQIEVSNKVVSVHVSPVTNASEYLGLVSVFRDITREVAADRIKSEFVATVSHELRTPMTSIKGYADLLLLGAAGEITDEQRRFLEVVKSNADRLSMLVNDLLDISRIEQGGVELDIRPFDLDEVISDVMISMEGRRETEGRAVDFVVETPDGLPKLEGDYDRVTQILTNLVSNAYQYTPDGGTVTVKTKSVDSGVQVDIIDTGIGIPEEAQSRIFERFFRGEDPMVMATAGTGLGLAIVRNLVVMHGGRVWFESREGIGTTFSIWLPFKYTSQQ